MECYISSSEASTIENVSATIRARPYGSELLVTGDLNVNLADPEGTLKGEAIADELTAAGIEDMGLQFSPCLKPWLQDRCTWRMRKDEKEVWYRTDYILGIYHRLFQDVAVQDPQHNSDHYMFLGCLRGEPAKRLTEYLCKMRRSPLRPIHCDLAPASEKIFSELKTQIPTPP